MWKYLLDLPTYFPPLNSISLHKAMILLDIIFELPHIFNISYSSDLVIKVDSVNFWYFIFWKILFAYRNLGWLFSPSISTCLSFKKFYFEIIMDSKEVTNKCATRLYTPFTQALPMLTSCMSIVEHQSQGIHTVCSDFTSYTVNPVYMMGQGGWSTAILCVASYNLNLS